MYDVLVLTKNLYYLSDISQLLIKEKCEKHGWPLSTYPKKIGLPKLFVNLDSKTANATVATIYYKKKTTKVQSG
jgi:hypothetical protein